MRARQSNANTLTKDTELLRDLQNAYNTLNSFQDKSDLVGHLLSDELSSLCLRITQLANTLSKSSLEKIQEVYSYADVRIIFQYYELALKKAIQVEKELLTVIAQENLQKIRKRIQFFKKELNPAESNLKERFRFIINQETRLPPDITPEREKEIAAAKKAAKEAAAANGAAANGAAANETTEAKKDDVVNAVKEAVARKAVAKKAVLENLKMLRNFLRQVVEPETLPSLEAINYLGSLIEKLNEPVAFQIFPKAFIISLSKIFSEKRVDQDNLKAIAEYLKETIDYFFDEDSAALEKRNPLQKKKTRSARAMPVASQQAPAAKPIAKQKQTTPKSRKPHHQAAPKVSRRGNKPACNELAELIMFGNRQNLARIKKLFAENHHPIYPFELKKYFARGVAVFLGDFSDEEHDILISSIPTQPLKRKSEESQETQDPEEMKSVQQGEQAEQVAASGAAASQSAPAPKRQKRESRPQFYTEEVPLPILEEKKKDNIKPMSTWGTFLSQELNKKDLRQITEDDLSRLDEQTQHSLFMYTKDLFLLLKAVVRDKNNNRIFVDPVKTASGKVYERDVFLNTHSAECIEDFFERVLVPCYPTRSILTLLGLPVKPLKKSVSVLLPFPLTNGATQTYIDQVILMTRGSAQTFLSVLGFLFPNRPITDFFVENRGIWIRDPQLLAGLKRLIYDLQLQGNIGLEPESEMQINDPNAVYFQISALYDLVQSDQCTHAHKSQFMKAVLSLLPALEQIVKDENNNPMSDPVFDSNTGLISARSLSLHVANTCSVTAGLVDYLFQELPALTSIEVFHPASRTPYLQMDARQIDTLINILKTKINPIARADFVLAFEFGRMGFPISLKKLRAISSTKSLELIRVFYNLCVKYSMVDEFHTVMSQAHGAQQRQMISHAKAAAPSGSAAVANISRPQLSSTLNPINSLPPTDAASALRESMRGGALAAGGSSSAANAAAVHHPVARAPLAAPTAVGGSSSAANAAAGGSSSGANGAEAHHPEARPQWASAAASSVQAFLDAEAAQSALLATPSSSFGTGPVDFFDRILAESKASPRKTPSIWNSNVGGSPLLRSSIFGNGSRSMGDGSASAGYFSRLGSPLRAGANGSLFGGGGGGSSFSDDLCQMDAAFEDGNHPPSFQTLADMHNADGGAAAALPSLSVFVGGAAPLTARPARVAPPTSPLAPRAAATVAPADEMTDEAPATLTIPFSGPSATR